MKSSHPALRSRAHAHTRALSLKARNQSCVQPTAHKPTTAREDGERPVSATPLAATPPLRLPGLPVAGKSPSVPTASDSPWEFPL